jgi:hypothetical protein
MQPQPPRNLALHTSTVEAQPPKVLQNHSLDGPWVRVEHALPGLRRCNVIVPEHRWLAGGHVTIGLQVAKMLAALDLQRAAQAGSVPE